MELPLKVGDVISFPRSVCGHRRGTRFTVEKAKLAQDGTFVTKLSTTRSERRVYLDMASGEAWFDVLKGQIVKHRQH